MKKLILASVFALSISPAFAQQLSQQEVCLDMSAAASTIALNRDDGFPPEQFVSNVFQQLEQGQTSATTAKAVLVIAEMIYFGDLRNMTPSQAQVVIYRRCMGSGV